MVEGVDARSFQRTFVDARNHDVSEDWFGMTRHRSSEAQVRAQLLEFLQSPDFDAVSRPGEA